MNIFKFPGSAFILLKRFTLLTFLFLTVEAFTFNIYSNSISAIASGNWSNGSVWSGGVAPTSSDAVAISGFTISIDIANPAVGSLTGNGTLMSNIISTLTVGTDNTNTLFSGILQNGSAILSITKTGTGILTLSGANTYTGVTTISSGTLQVGNASALGTVAGGTIVSNGAVLDLNGTTYSTAEPLTINGTGILGGGAIINSSALAATFAGLLKLGSSASIVAGNGTITVSNAGIISGPTFGLTLGGAAGGTLTSILGTTTGALTKQDAGTWTLSGANTYTGLTTIIAGTLKLGNALGLGTIATGTIINTGAVLDLNGINYSNAEPLTVNGTGISGGGAIINNSATAATFAGLLTLGSSSNIVGGIGTITLSNPGIITGGYDLLIGGAKGGTLTSILGTGAANLIKADAGTWTLSGTNTYTGLTTIIAGTLKLNNPQALGTIDGATIVAAGAALDLNGINYNLSEPLTINGTGIPVNTGAILNSSATAASFAGLITLGSTSSIIGGSGTISISNPGTITGSGLSLTLGGAKGGTLTGILGTDGGSLTLIAGTWTLSAANTFTGGTTLSAGTLNINNPQALGMVGGTFTITGGIIDNTSGAAITTLNYPLNCTNSFSFNGTNALNLGTGGITISANKIVTVAANTFTLGGIISPSVSLTKSGAGTLALSSTPLSLLSLTINSGTFIAPDITNLTGAFTNAGTFISSTNTLNLTGSFTNSGTFLAPGIFNLTGNFSNTGTFTHNNGTLNWNGTQIAGATLHNLTVATGKAITLLGTVSVDGILSMTTDIIDLGVYDFTITNSGSINGGPFSITNMIKTSSTGSLVKQSTTVAGFQMTYPVGNGSYTPMIISSLAASLAGTESISVRTTAATAPGAYPDDLKRYWTVNNSPGLTAITANINFTYINPGDVGSGGVQTSYVPTLNTSIPIGNSAAGANPFSSTGTTALAGNWTAQTPENTLYSYQSGDWNSAGTWTTDPGGTTQIGSSVPSTSNHVVILSNRTVSLSNADITTANIKITVNNGGFLDLTTHKFTVGLSLLEGQGTVKLASVNFPVTTTNTLVNSNGGSVEYNAGVTLPIAQTTYNNLTVNTSGTVIQVNNLLLNGNLVVKQGTFQLNDASALRRTLTINGNVTVNNGAFITVGMGNTTTTTNPIGINTTVAGPIIDYYDKQSHRVVVMGDFTNNGTVRFTNQPFPVYNAFPTTGMATVYFQGSTNNTLTCNNTTDFYNLVLDKGIDKTYSLTINASQYNYFRLFGANTAPGDNIVGGTNANPNIKKALWLRNGTLDLKGLVVIPSLSEGATNTWPSSDFIIPSNAALILDGINVIVMSTADDYGEVNAAYGVSGGTGSVNGITQGGNTGIAVLGNLQLNNGYLSTRESTGITYWSYASGQLIMNNGILDTKQIDDASGSNSGLFTYSQTGGTVYLRGRFQHNMAYSSISDLVNTSLNTSRISNGINTSDGTFHLNTNSGSGFAMGGGIINIYDVCGTAATSYAFYANCPVSNINVTGGTVQLIPTTGTSLPDANYLINTNASIGNFIINSASGTSIVQLNTNPLTVLQNLTIQSGTLDAQSLNLTVAGDFIIPGTGIYNSGTNTTTFNGSVDQMFSVDGVINNGTVGLSNMTVNKTTGKLSLSGIQSSLTVQNQFSLTAGTLNDGGKTIYIAGNVTNSGLHTGTGKIQLNGATLQSIGGNGTGVFQNLELNNTNSALAPVSLLVNATINGVLTFSQDKLFNIGTYNLQLNSGATIINGSNTRYIQTAGNSGDGGLTKIYASTNSFIFPVGSVSTSHTTTPVYTPASIGFTSAPTTFGSITIIPVGYVHPSSTIKVQSLSYFWKVKSSGFSGIATNSVTHTFVYDQSDVLGSENNYIPSLYNRSNYTWNSGTTANPPINTATNTITDWTSPTNSTNFLDADYTAGDNTTGGGAFGTPRKFYSCINGALAGSGLWSNAGNWSYTGNTGPANTLGAIPGINDIVIISGNDSVFLATNITTANTGVQNCASLQIEKGSALDIGFNPNCVFSMVLSHPNGNGNFRLTTSNNTGSTYLFPGGDFSEFNQNLGTTELYTTNSASGTIYWLPQGVMSYGNLILSPLGGSNIIFSNNNLTIYGNLITRGQSADSWFCPSWNTAYPTAPTALVAKTITINGNLLIQGGSLIWYGNGAIAQNVVVNGDVVVSTWASIQNGGGATNQSLAIGGSLINNTNNTLATGTTTTCKVDFSYNSAIPVTFFGSNNASITNISGTPLTVFSNLTVNKGSSQASTLTCNIGGILTTPVDNWLTLQNGTFLYARTNPAAGENFNISTGTSLTIPATAGLNVNMPGNNNNINILIANSGSNTNDLFLNGKLTLGNGNIYVGPINGTTINNNDIEYSNGGSSAIEIDGGNLIVNGAIRRNLTNAAGVLNFSQTAGNLTINGNNITGANAANAKLEVLNTGSVFNMSGGTITIVRGGGTTFGDLYLRPNSGAVTGGSIIFTQSPAVGPVVTLAQNYLLDANIPLYNLTINGLATSSFNAKVNLMVSPLVLKGDLVLSNTYSILNAVNGSNSMDLTINGNLNNNGTYLFGTNNTIFNGNVQTISGSSTSNFYNLQVNPLTSLTLSSTFTVNHNLTINSGQLLNGIYSVNLLGNITNNATYDGDAVLGGIILNGITTQQHIAGTGTFGRLEINNGVGNVLDNSITLQKNLKLTTGVLNISQYLLTLGVNSTIEGSNFGSTKMIVSDGVYSNFGVKKFFPVISSPTTFTYPIGSGGKYTPANLTINTNGSVGFVRVNNINSHHPAVLDPNNFYNIIGNWKVQI